MTAETPSLDPTAKPRRRSFQFSLRTLLALTLVVAAGLSLVIVPLERARRRAAAIAEVQRQVERLGGAYWVGNRRGDVMIHLGETDVADVNLEQMKPYLELLTALKTLDLEATRVSDAGLVHLESLRSLEYLGLTDTAVTEAGASRLHLALPDCWIKCGARPHSRSFNEHWRDAGLKAQSR